MGFHSVTLAVGSLFTETPAFLRLGTVKPWDHVDPTPNPAMVVVPDDIVNINFEIGE
jgi:hypothetical protein